MIPGFAAFSVLFVIAIIFGVVVLSLIPALLAFLVLNRVPPQFQKQSPGLAFLLVIPLFNLVWSFFVHPKVAESLQAYFESNGDKRNGDCGRSIALALCICMACGIVPFAGFLAAPAALILYIIFYVKAFSLSATIPQPVSMTFPPAAAAAPISQPPPPPPPPSATTGQALAPAPTPTNEPKHSPIYGDVEAQLRRLKDLYEKGLITETEYQSLKQKALVGL
jgi:hypothetical protein